MPPAPTETPVPERMRGLPKWRGIPIPYFIADVHPRTGEPLFKTPSSERQMTSWLERLCGICGQPLDELITFVRLSLDGNPFFMIAFLYHDECARYALQVCPFFAAPLGTRMRRLLSQKAARPFEEVAFLFRTRSYEIVEYEPEGPYIGMAHDPDENRWLKIGPMESEEEFKLPTGQPHMSRALEAS